MAIYRPPRARWPAIAGAALLGLLLGVVLGWAIRGGGSSDPGEVLAEVGAGVSSASNLLEVAEIEYSEAVVDGEVAKEAELSGARDAVARSRQRYEEVAEAVALIDAAAAADIAGGYDEVIALMDTPADAAEVTAALDALGALLEGVTK